MTGSLRCAARQSLLFGILVGVAAACDCGPLLDKLVDCKLCDHFKKQDLPQPPYGPSRAFLDQYAAVISGTLLLTKKSPEAAAAAAVQLFQAARQYTHAIAANQTTQPNIVTQILTSQFANITNILGTKLAEYLPSKVGIDRFRYNYTEAVLPGLTTALTGLQYSPCISSNAGLGDIIGATAIGIAPKVFNQGAAAAALIAEAIAVNPTLLYVSNTAEAGVAIGVNIAPSLISVTPAHHVGAKVGYSAAKSGISVSLVDAMPFLPGPAPAPVPDLASGAAPAAQAPGVG